MNPNEAWMIDESGWCPKAQRLLSPNHDERPPDVAVDLLVVHNVSLPPGEFNGPWIADLFLNRLDCDAHPYFRQLRDLKVSAHFLVRRDGSLIQFVPTRARAWHAGASHHCGRERCNDFSVGVELEGSDFVPFTDHQYSSLSKLSFALCQRHPIRSVVGHEHVAPTRKTDPGPFFDWPNFRRGLDGLLIQHPRPSEALVPLSWPDAAYEVNPNDD